MGKLRKSWLSSGDPRGGQLSSVHFVRLIPMGRGGTVFTFPLGYGTLDWQKTGEERTFL